MAFNPTILVQQSLKKTIKTRKEVIISDFQTLFKQAGEQDLQLLHLILLPKQKKNNFNNKDSERLPYNERVKELNMYSLKGTLKNTPRLWLLWIENESIEIP